jgi:tetratricopeptide (TPR) repeat protein
MSRRDDLQQLIINYGRRLQKLQEQQALMGLDTSPHILIEIEDIQAKMAELQEKLAALAEADFVAEPPYPIPEQHVQPYPQPTSQPPTQRAIFVGRQAQLAELERYWQEAYQQQRGKVIFLVGEAGIGKTSLVREFSQGMLTKYPQVQYAEAQCDQIAGDISPYAPFVQLLNKLTEQATQRGKHWSVEFIREIGPDILGMVPVAGPILATAAKSADFAWRKRQQADSGLDRFGQQDIFQQFTDTFRNLARRKNPLLLFIDDWHWADTSSTNLLFHLARQLKDVPILLLATYRPHDAQARQHPILSIRTEMERYQLCAGISLDFLSRDDLIAYLNRRFPQAQFEPAFVDWLLDITNGNALFTSEYVNLLLNEKLLTSDGQLVGDLGQMLPPANVEAVIRSRLRFLDQEARDILAYGSVEGEQFTTLVLSHLLELKLLPLLKRLRIIEETHQLITSLGQQTVYEQQTTVYRFIHTLIHRTLYNSLEVEERAEINRLLLKLHEEVYAQANELTKSKLAPELMSYAAQAGDHLAQARYALVAAEVAADNYALNEAIKLCRQGLTALDHLSPIIPEVQVLKLDLLLRLGGTESYSDNHAQALEIRRQAEAFARESNQPRKLLEALTQQANTLRHLIDHAGAQKLYEEAIVLAERIGDKTQLADIYQGLVSVFLDLDYDQALMWSQKALNAYEESGNEGAKGRVYNHLGLIYSKLGHYDQALEFYKKALAIDQKFKPWVGWDYNNIAIVYRNQGNFEQALDFFQKALAVFQEVKFKRGQAAAMNGMGIAYGGLGQYPMAEELFKQSIMVNTAIQNLRGLGWNYSGIGDVCEYQMDYSQALEWFQKALTVWNELGIQTEIDGIRKRITAVQAKLVEDSD